MSSLLGRSAGIAGIVISGLMVLTSCGSAASTATPPPPNTAVPPTSMPATAVPTPAAVGSPTAVPTAVPTSGNSGASRPGSIVNTIPKFTAADVHMGGTYHNAIGNDPACYDPYCASTGISPPMYLLTAQKLIRYKSINYPEYADWGAGIFQGELLSSWDISADGKTFTLHLRQGNTWPAITNRDGVTLPARPITSADVLFSWKQMATTDPVSVIKSFYASQTSATAPDANTVVTTTDNAYADWIGTTYANGETQFIERADYVQALGTQFGLDFNSMYGSGAFTPAKSTQGSEYDFVKNPTYYLTGWPALDGQTDYVIKDSATTQAAFLAGKIDNIAAPTLAQAQQWQQTDADITIWQGEALAHNPIGMQEFVKSGPYSDLKVRQAISLLFPWNGMISALFAGNAAYTGCIPSGYVNVSESQATLQQEWHTDAAAAAALLTSDGYSSAKPLMVTALADPAGTVAFQQAQLLQAAVEATGIAHMNIQSIAFNQSRAQVIAGNFQSAWQPLATGTITKIMNAFYGGGAQGPMGSQNYMQLNDPKVNTWYEQQSVDFNVKDRASIIQAFNAYCSQQAWILPMPTPPSYSVTRSWLKNSSYLDFYNDENTSVWKWIDPTVAGYSTRATG